MGGLGHIRVLLLAEGSGAQGHELLQRVRLSQGAELSGMMSGFTGGVQGRFLGALWAVTALLSVCPSSPSALSSAVSLQALGSAVTALAGPARPSRASRATRSGAAAR